MYDEDEFWEERRKKKAYYKDFWWQLAGCFLFLLMGFILGLTLTVLTRWLKQWI